MEHLGFIGSKRFIRVYSLLALIVFSIAIISSIVAVTANLLVQSMMSLLVVGGVLILFGLILLLITYVDKKDVFGGIIHHLSYITLIILMLSFTFLALGSYMTSFYIFGSYSLGAGSTITTIIMTVLLSFGLCLASIAYHSLKIESVWREL
jgi:hypothetical protein